MLLGRLLLAGFLVGAVGCGDDVVPDVAQDSAADVEDAAREADTASADTRDDVSDDVDEDVDGDEGVDSSDPDAGPDDPGWIALEFADLPEGCMLWRAEHAERVIDAEWEECGDGCQNLAPDPALPQRHLTEVAWQDGTSGLVVVRQDLIEVSGGRNDTTIVVLRSGGAAELALRYAWEGRDVACGWAAMAGTGSTFAASLYKRDETVVTFDAQVMALGERFEILSTVPVPADATPGSSVIQRGALSDDVYTTQVQPLAQVFAFQDGERTAMGGGLGTARGSPQTILSVGETSLWEAWGDEIILAYGRRDLPGAVYRAVPGARITGIANDGNTLAWVQAYNSLGEGRYERAELWTAEFTPDPEDLEPRMVREIGAWGGPGIFGGGYYARIGPGFVTELVELETGDIRLVTPPDGTNIFNLYYVNSEELVLGGALIERDAGITVFRFEIDSLPVEEE